MYNEKEKMLFVSEFPNKEKDFLYLFNITEQYEIEKGKDISRFSKLEAIYLLKDIGPRFGLKLKKMSDIKGNISQYAEWKISKEGGINAFLMLNPDDIDECAADIEFYDLDEIEYYAFKSENPVDRAIPYLVFYGFSDQEILAITPEAIRNGQINTCDRVNYVDLLASDIILDACNTYEYKHNKGSYPLSKLDRSPLKATDYENFNASDNPHSRVTNKLKHLGKITGGSMFTKRILRSSGIIYHLKQDMEYYHVDKNEIFKKEYVIDTIERYQLKCKGNYLKRMYGRYL